MQFNITFKTIFEYVLKKLVLCIQIRFVSTEKTTRIASRASCSSHCYCHPVIYSLSLFIIYSVNSFIANVICYITIPSLNKVLYLVSCIL